MYKDKVVYYAKNNFEKLEECDGFPIYKLDETEQFRIKARVDQIRRHDSGMDSVRSSVLLSLIATYDAVFSDFCKFLLRQNPERYDGAERNFKLKELLSLQSIDEIVDKVIDEEVDQLMNRSHADQIGFFEKSFHVKFADTFDRWSEFMEIFERRNLAAHGDLIVNKIYTANCMQHGRKDCPALGTKLRINYSYMEKSLDILLEVFIMIAFATWRKRLPAEADSAFSMIVERSFAFLRDGRPNLAQRITEQALKIKDVRCERITELMLVVNNAIAHRCQGNQDDYMKRLDSIDWSATSPIFKLCVAAVRGNTDEVCKHVEAAKIADNLGLVDLREWPVFQWVRSDEEFEKAVLGSFGEPLTKSSTLKADGDLLIIEDDID